METDLFAPEYSEKTFNGSNQASGTAVSSGKIPVCYYIANNSTAEAIYFLQARGISIKDRRDIKQVAKALKYIIQHGNDRDYEDLKKIHPDYDLFEEEKAKAEHFKNVNAEIPTTNVVAKETKNETTISESVINVRTAYALIGIGGTLAAIGLISWAVKNIKS